MDVLLVLKKYGTPLPATVQAITPVVAELPGCSHLLEVQCLSLMHVDKLLRKNSRMALVAPIAIPRRASKVDSR